MKESQGLSLTQPTHKTIGPFFLFVISIDIKSLQNKLLKVCYVPASSADLPRVSFFFSSLFLLPRPLTVLMKQTRQAVHAIKQPIFLDVYGRISSTHIIAQKRLNVVNINIFLNDK